MASKPSIDPNITPSLIEWLDQIYPDRAPTPEELRDPLLVADIVYGASVVRRIKSERDRQIKKGKT